MLRLSFSSVEEFCDSIVLQAKVDEFKSKGKDVTLEVINNGLIALQGQFNQFANDFQNQ